MSVNLKGKIYRNQNEQIVENANDITKLDKRITDLEESVEESIGEINENFSNYVSKANLTDHSINEISVGASEIDSDNVDLNAVYSQDVKSQLSLEPNSAVLRTMSGDDVSTIGISATEVNVLADAFKYNGSEVATKGDIPAIEKKTLVWTNPNPTSNFENQSVQLNLINVTNPKYLEIEWKNNPSTSGFKVERFNWELNSPCYLSSINMAAGSCTIRARSFMLQDSFSIILANFDRAYTSTTFNTPSESTSVVIPYKIYVIE